MIIDHLAHAPRYQVLHPLFPRAFAWLGDARNRTLSAGRYPLQDEDLFAIVDSGTTGAASDKRLEGHRRYIDIQVNLQGSEAMEWTPVDGLRVVQDFLPDNDIRFFAQPEHTTRLLVPPEHFTIFWPQDAHKPCCHPYDLPVAFRKIVFKVAKDAT